MTDTLNEALARDIIRNKDKRIRELEAKLKKPFICIRCQRKALRGIGKTGGEG